ncbi:MAG: LacI family DNA-binding transcriptional regulator [Bacteroidota bacterium]
MNDKRVTIRDVARRAGVSTGTVSAVINNRPSVRANTREHVLGVMERMGYAPSSAARRLGGLHSDLDVFEPAIGLVVKELDNPFYTEVMIGARDELAAAGYLAFLTSSGGDFSAEGRLIDAARNRSMSGAIIAPVLHEQVDLSHLFELRRSGYPFVLLENVPGLQASSVSVDNIQAAQMAASHLIHSGHERIVHFAGPAYTQHTRDRITGFERAFSQSHLRFHPELVVGAGAHFREGYETAVRYFSAAGAERPTAVTCFNDLVAMGVLKALAEAGLRVPDDVSVVGFDDIPMAAFFSVPLTTVSVAKREMGRLAARTLLRQLAQPGTDPEQVLMEARLVERRSTRHIS